MARADVEALVDDIVQDGARLRGGARDRAIDQAVARYSKDRPRTVIADVTAIGGYALPLPPGWAPGSRVLGWAWPPGAGPAARRPAADLIIDGTPTGEQLAVRREPWPAAGAAVRITFTAFHRLTDAEDTIPAADAPAVANLAASFLLEQLAVATAGDTDSTIPADAVDHKGASERYAARARTARKVYDDHVGASGTDPGTAGAGAAAVSLAVRRGGMFRRRGG